jgi:2-polyprenyl-6-methoxyphenol hydroxylase-like FAD-dependent oxidoreductase
MRAVICGGGIGGLALAWWLRHDGWQVTVVEVAGGPRGGGYVMDFWGAGVGAARQMGLLPAMAKARIEISAVEYRDTRGRPHGRIDYARFATAIGGDAYSLTHTNLHRILLDAIGDQVDIRYGCTVEQIEDRPSGIWITLTGGQVERADLLVGADGIHSRVRALLFGPEQRWLRPLGFHTAAYHVGDPALRREIGAKAVITAEPGRQVALYPTVDGGLAVWLVHRTDEPIPAAPAATIMRTYAGMGDLADRALAYCPDDDRLYYDLVAQIDLHRWHAGRTVLIGDAAGAVSLMAGQGAVLAVSGARALARELGTVARAGRAAVPGTGDDAAAPAASDDLVAAVNRYEERFRPVTIRAQRAGRRTARWLVPSTRSALRLRAAALWLLDLPGTGPLIRVALAPANRD